MTKANTVRRIQLTDAARNSHRETMNIHRERATEHENAGEIHTALAFLKAALPHANAVQDRAVQSEIFIKMNTLRAKIRKEQSLKVEGWYGLPSNN